MNINYYIQFSSVAQSCPTLCNPMDYTNQDSLHINNSWSLLKREIKGPFFYPKVLQLMIC